MQHPLLTGIFAFSHRFQGASISYKEKFSKG